MAKVNVIDHNHDGAARNAAVQAPGQFDVDPAKDLKTFRALMILCSGIGTAQTKNDTSVSQRMLDLARPLQGGEFIRAIDGERDERGSEKFIIAVSAEESFIRSLEAGAHQVKNLPRCWTQAKSNIKAALEYGIDLADYNSEAALRKAVIKARGMRKQNAVKEAMNSATKRMIEELPQERALELVHHLEAALDAALQELVPEKPVKAA